MKKERIAKIEKFLEKNGIEKYYISSKNSIGINDTKEFYNLITKLKKKCHEERTKFYSIFKFFYKGIYLENLVPSFNCPSKNQVLAVLIKGYGKK